MDDELAELEQEELDDKMLQTGNVPVSDEIGRLPTAANGESMLCTPYDPSRQYANLRSVKAKKASVEEDEEEELRKLQAEMAM